MPARNIRLQRPARPADQINAMTTVIRRANGGQDRENPRSGTQLSTRELAHELNSLLDGSLRSLRLAQRALQDTPQNRPELLAEAATRLEAAHQAMREMAEVLERAMQGSPDAAGLAGRQTVGEIARLAESAVAPMCADAGVSLAILIAPDAAEIPAGPLAFVLINALRNAVQACGAAGNAERAVDASIELSGDGTSLTLTVTDTGTGLSERGPEYAGGARGHGIGLDVCRRIVADLNGTLSLAGNDAGRGARLRVEVAVRSLVER